MLCSSLCWIHDLHSLDLNFGTMGSGSYVMSLFTMVLLHVVHAESDGVKAEDKTDPVREALIQLATFILHPDNQHFAEMRNYFTLSRLSTFGTLLLGSALNSLFKLLVEPCMPEQEKPEDFVEKGWIFLTYAEQDIIANQPYKTTKPQVFSFPSSGWFSFTWYPQRLSCALVLTKWQQMFGNSQWRHFSWLFTQYIWLEWCLSFLVVCKMTRWAWLIIFLSHSHLCILATSVTMISCKTSGMHGNKAQALYHGLVDYCFGAHLGWRLFWPNSFRTRDYGCWFSSQSGHWHWVV